MGSAVDTAGITHMLEEYRRAGLGGVEITPIYGVQGYEDREVPYLSPEWMDLLAHTVREAHRLGLGVDMATGTGWPFGGPHVSDEDALDRLVLKKVSLVGGDTFTWNSDDGHLLAAACCADVRSSQTIERADWGHRGFTWVAPPGEWTLYCAAITWGGRNVKRAAPGAAGKCINPFSQESLLNYLAPFESRLMALPKGSIRCQFHDSFEYLANWSLTLFDEFETRRGYDLCEHLHALAGDSDSDSVTRVKTDYRETISELLLENFTRTWTQWSNRLGCLSRNQAHGSPGNLLDLYAAADIPETEIFGQRTDSRNNRMASSAAHVMGKPLVSSETCTWLSEHFNVTLAQAKSAIDSLFLSGINHIFYHGTAYSPPDVPWPGWLFYASTTFAPQDPIWRDFPTLNDYVTRCQSLLQAGTHDNDVLLYWPLHDLWQKRPDVFMFEINGDWLTGEPAGDVAESLTALGYSYDFVSDRQLALATADAQGIRLPGVIYAALVVPPCDFMPADTLANLARLVSDGCPVLFLDLLPTDVPGLANLDERRKQFDALLRETRFTVGSDLSELLAGTAARAEIFLDSHGGRAPLSYIRRRLDNATVYFLKNTGEAPIDDWISFATPAQSATLMDPMTGDAGVAVVKTDMHNRTQVRLQLQAGESIFVRLNDAAQEAAVRWPYSRPLGDGVKLPGPWSVEFVEGGPTLPPSIQILNLESWTDFEGVASEAFAGTAAYSATFDAPTEPADEWHLDLGRVCESARVFLNGEDVGATICAPHRVRLPQLKSHGNTLRIEVTNLAANRIRHMDRVGETWRIFHEINFVNIDYAPFDASDWLVRESGLIGPVRLIPMAHVGEE